MTSFNPQQFIETQRNDWNRVSSAWEKWDAWLEKGFEKANQYLIETAGIREGDRVLDLGSGTGHPAIPIAEKVGSSGEVIGMDIAKNMLEVARRKAEFRRLLNVHFRPGGIETLPFKDGEFNAVTSRYCLMFLPHLDATLREVFRVLKPGGMAAALVWAAPEKNPYITLATGVLKEFIEVPQPDPALPGIFALAKPGDLRSRMESAGFKELHEEEVPVEGVFASGAEFLECLKEMAAPLQGLFAKLSPDQLPKADEGIIQAAEKYLSNGKIQIPGVAIGVSGSRPA